MPHWPLRCHAGSSLAPCSIACGPRISELREFFQGGTLFFIEAGVDAATSMSALDMGTAEISGNIHQRRSWEIQGNDLMQRHRVNCRRKGLDGQIP
jgi:hypothetical protein